MRHFYDDELFSDIPEGKEYGYYRDLRTTILKKSNEKGILKRINYNQYIRLLGQLSVLRYIIGDKLKFKPTGFPPNKFPNIDTPFVEGSLAKILKSNKS
jgi:hypothetical protein